jgi:formate--tetrahydrofolate ligase
VERGLENLEKHVERIRIFEENPIVALNRFDTDSDEEVEVVRACCERLDVPFAVSDIYAEGGEGGRALAEAVVRHADSPDRKFKPLYDWSEPIKDKMHKVASKMYGASAVRYTGAAEKDLKDIERLGYSQLPLSVAKTPTSLSDNPRLSGRPRDFEIVVRGFIVSAGAGFVVPLLGDIMRMPGLAAAPQAEQMDLVDGEVKGFLGG